MMKKVIALMFATFMVLGMVSCNAGTSGSPAGSNAGSSAPQNSSKPAEASSAGEKKEPVSLEVWVAQVDWADAWTEMEERFEEQHPWIQLDHVGLGEDANFLQQRLATNDLPAVIQLNKNETMLTMAENNLLADVSGYECAKVMPQSYADAYTIDGKMVGMCQGAAFSCMFYNMKILNDAGWTNPPQNWDELLQCCKDIKEKTGIAPLTTAAGKTTTSWMIFELILANLRGKDVSNDEYVQAFKDGTFDFAQDPEVAKRLDALAPYFLEGTATAQEEDVANYLSDGLVAMCVAGNWNGGMICPAIAEAAGDESLVAASLPPFGAGAGSNWISVSPEDAFCITVDPNRTEAEQEAIDIFYNWMFEAENFQLIQNARGTVPVISNMTNDQIVLPEAMVPVVADMGSAPFYLMGFNMWTAEFKDAACAKIQGVITGDNNAQDAVTTMTTMVKEYPMNK